MAWNDNGGGGNRKPIPKTALDENKLALKGTPHENAKRRNGYPQAPAFKVSFMNNNPRFSVFTNVDGDDENYGRIDAPMNSITAAGVIDQLYSMIEGEPKVLKMENYQGQPGKQQLKSTTVFGKDKEGRMFIALQAEGRPNIKFVFVPTDWHHLRNADGSDADQVEISKVFCRGWCRHMAQMIPILSDSFYVEPEPRKGGGGGGNRGGGNNSGGGGSNYGSSGGFEDDLPM